MTDSSGQPNQPPKIIVDSDWKQQAQKEREKLAEKERQAKEAAEKQKAATVGIPGAAVPGAGGAASGGGPGGAPAMPQADFQALIGTLATQALMYMGAFPDPETGRAIVSLEHAKFNIDLISVLEEKTKGNLTQEEATDLSQAGHELRLRFVEIVQAIAQMQKEGKLKPQGGMGGMGGGMGGMGGAGGMGPVG